MAAASKTVTRSPASAGAQPAEGRQTSADDCDIVLPGYRVMHAEQNRVR